MIKNAPRYPAPVIVPTGVFLTLDVTAQRTAPPAGRTEAAAPQLMGLRMPAARPHRHKVPLRRLTAMCV